MGGSGTRDSRGTSRISRLVLRTRQAFGLCDGPSQSKTRMLPNGKQGQHRPALGCDLDGSIVNAQPSTAARWPLSVEPGGRAGQLGLAVFPD
jgi:hypothetical protein